MVGYGARRNGAFLFVLPIVISISFLLIADIDSREAHYSLLRKTCWIVAVPVP